MCSAPSLGANSVKKDIIRSLNVSEMPSAACITSNQEYGYGVASWHSSMSDAEHNARLMNGRAVPIHYDEDGEMVFPHEATEALDKFIGHPEE